MIPKVTSHETLSAISQLVQKLTGIELSEKNFTMIESRLTKRIQELNLKSLESYSNYLINNIESEKKILITLITTHHSYFFREFIHFEMLQKEILPSLEPIILKRSDKTLKVWSAACSRGQEVYSLAMFLDFYWRKKNPALKFQIYGTDIDSESIRLAQNGVYKREEIKEIPLYFLGNHFARGTGEIENFVKVKKSLQDFCHFEVQNLMDLISEKKIDQKYDLIFCRNVFIYFNSEKIKAISEFFSKKLESSGFLFIGVSENLTNLDTFLKKIGNSVYSLKEISDSQNIISIQKNNIKVVCVDDSKSILELMKKILIPEHGFEVIGTAENGLEAEKIISEKNPDIVTLDIHMPKKNGIEYLESIQFKKHPPIMMVTATSREEASLAGRAIELGAIDYVEKPTLSQFQEKGSEIRTKLKAALMSNQKDFKGAIALEKQFHSSLSEEIKNASLKTQILVFPLSSLHKVSQFIKNQKNNNVPPRILLLEGSPQGLTGLENVFKKHFSPNLKLMDKVPETLSLNDFFAFDLEQSGPSLFSKLLGFRKNIFFLFGKMITKNLKTIQKDANGLIFIEDLEKETSSSYHFLKAQPDFVPLTSFEYLLKDFLCKN